MTPEHVTVIPGTDHWILKGDLSVSNACQALGRLAIHATGPVIKHPIVAKAMEHPAVALDIGAFIGSMTRSLIDEFGALVFAFEPQIDAFSCLKHNCPEAFLFCMPVGAVGEQVTVYSLPHNQRYADRQVVKSSVAFHATQCLGIDTMHFPRVDFINISTAGFEHSVLKGMWHTLRQHRPVVLVEIDPVTLQDVAGPDPSRGMELFKELLFPPDYKFEQIDNGSVVTLLCYPKEKS